MGPLVSVVITTYNLGWCIVDTLQCVFAQTYQNTEIIVVDDASTDDTQARMAPFLERVTYIRHPTNQGKALGAEGGPARNTGIRHAKGDYIAFLDGDDLWEPEKLAVQVEAVQQFPRVGMIVVDGVSFAHEDNKVLRGTLLHDYGDTYCASLSGGAVVAVDLYRRFLQGCVIDTPSQVMVPSSVFREAGMFTYCSADDYEFYVRVSAKYEVALVKKSLVRYRCHAASVSGAIDRQFFRFAQPNLMIWKKHRKECRNGEAPFIRRQIQHLLETAAERAREEGQAGHRNWATGFLWDLLRRNLGEPGALYVALCLGRLWSPRWVMSIVRPISRRILRFRWR